MFKKWKNPSFCEATIPTQKGDKNVAFYRVKYLDMQKKREFVMHMIYS